MVIGETMMTREEFNARQRARRKENGNAATKKYEKTKRGFLMRVYRNMESRVRGIQKIKLHLYDGMHLLDRQDFYDWAIADLEFHRLFEVWEESGYERRLTPSVDRIDSSCGYNLANMEWVPFHENCRRGAVSRWAREQKV
jgi:hypothetical protein